MMQEDQKGCKKNNIRAEEEQITVARAKQHEDEEEDTGIAEKDKRQKKKAETGVLNSVMQEDQKGCKRNNIRAEEEQITAARAKHHEYEEKDTGHYAEKDKGQKKSRQEF